MLAAVCALALLIAASYQDLRSRKISNWISLTGLILGVVVLALSDRDKLGAVAGAMLFAVILGVFAYKSWMGWGDVKLTSAVALILGARLALYGLTCACVLAAVGIVAWHLTRGTSRRLFEREGRKQAVPFSPYLLAGTVVALLVG